jgi:hypothetical protein
MTTYAERRIVEELYGEKVADEQIALGIDAMNKAVAENGGPNGHDTRLHLDLKGRHPDDGLSDIAYEKGAALMRTIEANVGRERFDKWLKSWFDRHAFQPVTTAILLKDVHTNLVAGDKALENKLMLDRWVYRPGVPPNMVRPPATVFAEQDRAASRFAGGGAPPSGWAKWTTDERLRFLNRLPRKLSKARLDALQSALPQRQHEHGGALRLARSRGVEPLRSRAPLARAVPDVAGTRKVRPAIDQGARQGPHLGPASRDENLRGSAADLSSGRDPRA